MLAGNWRRRPNLGIPRLRRQNQFVGRDSVTRPGSPHFRASEPRFTGFPFQVVNAFAIGDVPEGGHYGVAA
jgi:hypothetical protein